MRATAYIVAATPRTGSSLLCEGLSATGVAGLPNEAFAPDFREMWRRHWRLDESVSISAYAEAALRRGTSCNGVTAFKIQWMHVAPLTRELEPPGDDVLSWLLPGAKFVNIVRRDRQAQALSWFRAIETNEWWRFIDAPAPAAPTLNVDTVQKLKTNIETQQAAWHNYFVKTNIAPLTVEYEALDQDYPGEITRVLEFLGLDPSAAEAIPKPRLTRQADAVTAYWQRHLDLVSPDRNG